MSEDTGKKKLGRGLSALLGDDVAADYSELDRVRTSKEVPVDQLHPSPFQPRHIWDQDALENLANSIAEKGILQPILVRRDPSGNGTFEIIAGERRWRAAQIAQLHEVPVIIKDLSDTDSLEIAIIENIQREDLSPIEEAEGFRRLIDEYSYTQEQLAKQLGKSRPHIANTMRLLGLPSLVQEMVMHKHLSAGAARALLTSDNPVELARQAVEENFSVREIERRVSKKPANRARSSSHGTKDQDALALEQDLSNAIGMKVAIAYNKNTGAGQITIDYKHIDQLDDICRRLSRNSIEKSSLDEDVYDGSMTSALDEDFH